VFTLYYYVSPFDIHISKCNVKNIGPNSNNVLLCTITGKVRYLSSTYPLRVTSFIKSFPPQHKIVIYVYTAFNHPTNRKKDNIKQIGETDTFKSSKKSMKIPPTKKPPIFLLPLFQ
jgi:hypothetical protein